jgi:hypothetical protein
MRPGAALFQIPSGASGNSNPTRNYSFIPAASLDQIEAIRAGRLDAGFVNFMPEADPELDQLAVGNPHVELAVPKRHPLAKLKKACLRDLVDAAFVWFPRWAGPTFYDQMMEACYRGGLKSPRIASVRFQGPIPHPARSTRDLGLLPVAILPVVDLNVTLRLALAWRRDNTSPLLASFIAEVARLPEVRALNKG